jgi:hypothetical protein
VIGISRDAADKHQRFRTKYGRRFPLRTDADHSVHDASGAWGERTKYGKTSIGAGPRRAGLVQRARRRPRRERAGRSGHLTAAGISRFPRCEIWTLSRFG